jgi:tetratricopeptide (TPR) repeat protein
VHTESNPAKGTQDFSDALHLLDGLPDGERRTAEIAELQARILGLLGWTQGQLGDFDHALENLKKAEPILDAQGAADPQNMGAQYRRVELDRSIGIVEGYAGQRKESLEYLRRATDIMAAIVKRDPDYRSYPLLLAELEGRVANLLVQAGRMHDARAYGEASVAYFKKLGDRSDATPTQLMECIRSLAETGIPSLRDYPTALRFALRADQLASGKNPAVLGFLAEAYGLNKNFPQALDAARRGLSTMPEIKPGDKPSQLRQWLEDEVKEYQGKSVAAVSR